MNYSSTWSGTHGPTDSEYRSCLFPGFPTNTAGGLGETGREDLVDSNLRDIYMLVNENVYGGCLDLDPNSCTWRNLIWNEKLKNVNAVLWVRKDRIGWLA